MVSKNTVIAFLLCTAVLLAVILIFQLHPSYAGTSSRAGDYVAASDLFSVTDADGDSITSYEFYDFQGNAASA